MGCLARILVGFFSCFLAGLVLFVAAVLVGFRALPAWLEHEVNGRTGFELSLAGAQANVFEGSISLVDLEIRNPPDYPVEGLVRMPMLGIDVAPLSVFTQRMVVDSLVIDIESFTWASPSDGAFAGHNLEALAIALGGEGALRPPTPQNVRTDAPFVIRRVDLRLQNLTLVAADGSARTFAPGIRLAMENVTDLNEVADALSRALSEADPGIPPGLFSTVDWRRLESLPGLFSTLGRVPGELLENVFEKSTK